MINEVSNIDNIDINKGIRRSESQLLKKLSLIKDELRINKEKSSAVSENDPGLASLKRKINNLRNEYIDIMQELSKLRASNKRKELKNLKLKKVESKKIENNSPQFTYNNNLKLKKDFNYAAPKIVDVMIY